jgi:hypothetical protein
MLNIAHWRQSSPIFSGARGKSQYESARRFVQITANTKNEKDPAGQLARECRKARQTLPMASNREALLTLARTGQG